MRHDAGKRRLDDGVIELALRLLDLCLGLQILRVLRHRNVRVAVEPGELHRGLLAQGFELALAGFQRETRLIVGGPGNGTGAHERRVAVIGRLIERDLRLLRGDVAQHAQVVLLHRIDGQRRLRKVGLGVVEGDLELPGIEAIQTWPDRHAGFP